MGEITSYADRAAAKSIWGSLLKMFVQLTAIAFIALGIIISWFTTGHPEGNEAWQLPIFTICYNLSCGFLASYIFYLINIYLPEQRKLVRHAELIATSIRKIRQYAELGEEIYNDSTNNDTYGNINILIKNEFRKIDKLAEDNVTQQALTNAFLFLDSRDTTQKTSYELVFCALRGFLTSLQQSKSSPLAQKICANLPTELKEMHS